MNRSELLDAFLKLMYTDDGTNWCVLSNFANDNGIFDNSLIESAGIELQQNGWVNERQFASSGLHYMITYKGKEMMDEYGSYTNYQKHLTDLRSKAAEQQNKNEKKAEFNQRLDRRNMRWAIVASISTLLLLIWTIILSVISNEKDKEIVGLKKQLEEITAKGKHND